MAQLIGGSGGYAATVGGNVKVFGTSDIDVISLADIAGTITFDGSFNRGGDFILLPNSAKSYTITRAGSSVTITDPDSTITIPVGTKGTTLQFADGELVLKFNGQVQLGSQVVTATSAGITATLSVKTTLPTATSSTGTLILAPNDPVLIGGNVKIFGTNGADTVTVADVAGNISFDGSFNRGGDKIVLSKFAENYSVARPSASNVVIGDEDTKLTIPLGTKGLDVFFRFGDKKLIYSDGYAYLGTQEITAPTSQVTTKFGINTLTKMSSVQLSMDQSGLGESFSILDINGDGIKEIIFFPANMRENSVKFKDVMSINIRQDYSLEVSKLLDSFGRTLQSEWVQDSAVADFNKDGKLDLIFAGSGSEPPDVLDQKGEKINLILTTNSAVLNYVDVNSFFVSAGFWHSLSVGYINSDNIPDLAVVRLGQPDPMLDHNGAFFLIGKGDGTFSLGAVPRSMTPYLNVGALVDVNQDGLDDYFWGTMWDPSGNHDNPRENRIYLNQDGMFNENYMKVPFLNIKGDRDPYHIATDKVKVGDYNNDGLQDLLIMYADYVDDNGRWLQLLRNNGDGTFTDIEYFQGFFSPRLSDGFEFFDFNNDGLLDIYQTIQFGGNFTDVFDYVFINKGNDVFEKYKNIYETKYNFDTKVHSNYYRFINIDGNNLILEIYTYDWMSPNDYKVSLNLYLIS